MWKGRPRLCPQLAPIPDFDNDGDLEHLVSIWPIGDFEGNDHKPFESDRAWWATIEDIRKTDSNLTAKCFCPDQAEAVEQEKAEILTNRLLDLEAEIKTHPQELLALTTSTEPMEARF